jgi:4-hydroxymandelate oxidase
MDDSHVTPSEALDALHERARAILPDSVLAYYDSGSGDGITVGEAAAAWDAWRLRPRVLRDVSTASATTTVMGTTLAAPVLVAPSAAHRLAHPDGESATAAGTGAAGSLLVLSTRSTTRMGTVAGVGAPWWMQVYVLADRGVSDEIAAQAAAHGAGALVLTGDTPVLAHKPRGPVPDLPDERLLPVLEERPDDVLRQAPDVTVDDIGRLREISGLPVLVKGVLGPQDAQACIDAGAAGVVVSNHGGRQLDGAVPSSWALPDVAQAVSGRGLVLVDGGVRTARHVLVALAMGAHAVLVGRPVLWALAVGGADGVAGLLRRLADDLAVQLALAGCRDVSDAAPDLIWQAAPTGRSV